MTPGSLQGNIHKIRDSDRAFAQIKQAKADLCASFAQVAIAGNIYGMHENFHVVLEFCILKR